MCDQGMSGHIWPDGRALLDQPNRLVEAWGFIGQALLNAKDGKPQELSE